MDKELRKALKKSKQEVLSKFAFSKSEVDKFAEEIANGIVNEVQREFAKIHLTGNLAATTTVTRVNSTHVKVFIPAVRYNLAAFKKLGVIEYQPEKGSYASTVSRTGGYSKTHKKYVTYAVMNGCYNALANHGIYDGAMKIKW